MKTTGRKYPKSYVRASSDDERLYFRSGSKDGEINAICSELERTYHNLTTSGTEVWITAFDVDNHCEFEIQEGEGETEIWFTLTLPYDKVKKLGVKCIAARLDKKIASIKAKWNKWPSSKKWYEYAEDEGLFDDMWSKWLSEPEEEVNKELQILPEPSVQGSMGGIFILDESGQERNENGFPWEEDWMDWYDWQVEAAAKSKNADEYKQKYREHIEELCGI